MATAATLQGDTGFRRLWVGSHPAAVRKDALARDLDTPEDVAEAIAAGLIDG